MGVGVHVPVHRPARPERCVVEEHGIHGHTTKDGSTDFAVAEHQRFLEELGGAVVPEGVGGLGVGEVADGDEEQDEGDFHGRILG